MRKTLLTVLLIVVLLLGAIPVVAETTIAFEQTNAKVLFEGMTGRSGTELVAVAIFRRDSFLSENGIFDREQAFSALTEAEDKHSILLYSNQTEAKEGVFSFSVRLERYSGLAAEASLSDVYTAVFQIGDTTVEKNFLYIVPLERTAALAALSALKTEDEATRSNSVSALLHNNKYAMGIYTDFFNDLNKKSLDSMLYNEIEAQSYTFTDEDEFLETLKKIVVICGLNEGKVDSVAHHEKELGLTGSVYGSWYAKSFVDTDFQAALTRRISKKSFLDAASFEKALTEALVLTYVEKADGLTPVKSIIEAFKKDIGISESYTDAAYRSVMGRSYSSYSQLVSALSGYESVSDRRPASGDGSRPTGDIKVSAPMAPQENIMLDISNQSGFSDVGNDFWAVKAISVLKEKGIVAGKSETLFIPNDPVTREEFVKLLVCMIEPESKGESLPFTDVPADAWYVPYLQTAYSAGIVNGKDDGRFGIGEPVSRQDLAVMLCRAFSAQGISLPSVKAQVVFADDELIADYAKDALSSLQTAGIVGGYEDGTVQPQGIATRAESAQMLYKVLLLMK